MEHNFTIFIDESGDEGFTFRDPPKKGSSDWFVVSAVATLSSQQEEIIDLGRSIRETLGQPRNWTIHFADMSHQQRIFALKGLASAATQIVTVAINKREILDKRTFTEEKFRLYFYALRLVLERVSWLCRDTAAKKKFKHCRARVIFEHRKHLEPDVLVDYFRTLRSITRESSWIAARQVDIRIHWPAFDESLFECAQKSQYAGLQMADLSASGFKAALEADRFGNTEHRYAKILVPKVYCRNSNYLSYGMKFFPRPPNFDEPFMHWVNKHLKK